MKLLALLLMIVPAAAIAQAPPTGATATTLIFAPPTGRKLRYELTQFREGKSGRDRFTLVREVEFTPVADGYRMTMKRVEASTSLTGVDAERYHVSMAAMADIVVRYQLDRAGGVIAVDNIDQIWAALPRARDGQLLASAGDANRRAQIERIFAALIALPPAARERMQRDDAERLLAFAGARPKPAEPVTEARESPSPFGGTIPVTVTSHWVKVDPDVAEYRAVTRSGGAVLRQRISQIARDLAATATPSERARLERDLAAMSSLSFEETVDYRVSRAWGVLVSSRSVKRVMSDKGEQIVEEIRKFGDWVS